MIQSFLLIGQSNMAGRGHLSQVPDIVNEGIKMLRNGRWQMMVEPINYDRPTAGVGLAASFGASWRLKNASGEIGFIPCADGGTSLDDWAVDGVLFEHAIAQAKLAQRSSNLAGILWHQGESDCFPERAAVYKEKFSKIIDTLRDRLGIQEVPLIIGGLGDFLTTGLYGKYFETYPLVNSALQEFAASQPNCYFVTAHGLGANADGLHFDAASQRIFGVRYFEAFDTLRNITQPLENEQEMLDAIYQRPLTPKEKRSVIENQFAGGKISLEEFQRQMTSIL